MDLLGDYRTEIDKIDKEMTKLLEKRMNVAKAISKYKMENNMQIFHPDREKMVIEKNKGYLENKEYEELVESSVCSFFEHTAEDGKNYKVQYEEVKLNRI